MERSIYKDLLHWKNRPDRKPLILLGARAKDFELALQWLVDAGLVYRVERCVKPVHPLKFYADNSAFKLYMLDCGLLACMAEASPNMLLLDHKPL